MTARLLGRWAVLGLMSVALLGATAGAAETASRVWGQRPEIAVRLSGIREHLTALQAIASRNGGNRAAGTAGYDASARYVASRMRAGGYRVRFQELEFPFVVDRSPPLLRRVDAPAWAYRSGRDYATLAYSGSGRVEAEVVAVDLLVPSPRANASTSGCEASDFEGFPRRAVALLQRGACTFRQKVTNAVEAGAGAVVVFNEGNPGRRDLFPGTLGPPQVRIPVLTASFDLGADLRNGVRDGSTGVRVELTADMIAEQRTTRNVIAESRAASTASIVVAGAHLDSVLHGPGINDNGSGSAAILEIAEQLAGTRPRNSLRFAWWGAEELGLYGSRYYVSRLSPAERRHHALYLNFDMVASPNFALFVYDGDDRGSSRRGPLPPPGSAAIERVFTCYLAARRLPYRQIGLAGSDHLPFARAGIPVGGLFTGASGRKSAAQAAAFGGRAGQPYDPCYHGRCDSLSNISTTALVQAAQAAAHAVQLFAQDVSSVRAAR